MKDKYFNKTKRQEELEKRLSLIESLSKEFKYKVVFIKSENRFIRLERDGLIVDIFYSTMNSVIISRAKSIQSEYDLVEMLSNPILWIQKS